MSMNVGREQSLLRQRLQAKASPTRAAERQQQHGGSLTFLGADDADVAQAAADLAAAYPQMGRAQMTAFVRTLWQSRIHELRDVGARLLAARAALLEPADLPFLEGLLQDDAADAVQARLARDVVGALVQRHKKLWKDLRRLAASAHVALRRAAARAAELPLVADDDAFPRFADVAAALLADADAALQATLDSVLVAAAGTHGEAVRTFAAQHGRTLALPKAKPRPKATAAAKVPAAPKPKAKPAAAKPRPAQAGKPAAKKPATRR